MGLCDCNPFIQQSFTRMLRQIIVIPVSDPPPPPFPLPRMLVYRRVHPSALIRRKPSNRCTWVERGTVRVPYSTADSESSALTIRPPRVSRSLKAMHKHKQLVWYPVIALALTNHFV